MRLLPSPLPLVFSTRHAGVLAIALVAAIHGYGLSSTHSSAPPPARPAVAAPRTAPATRVVPAPRSKPTQAQPRPAQKPPQQPPRQPVPQQPYRPTPVPNYGRSYPNPSSPVAPRVFPGERVVNAADGSQRIYANNGALRSVSANGMKIQHGPGNARVISAMHPDGSRATVMPGGGGWVQHPFSYRGAQYARRSYSAGYGSNDRYYRIYPWRGVNLSIYRPVRYYPASYYWWLGNPWGGGFSFSWGWGAAPWYGYYGGAFTPYSTYSSPAMWLTDYTLGDSMNSAYQQDQADGSANGQAPAINPMPDTVQESVNKEIEIDAGTLQQENQQETSGDTLSAPAGSLAQVLSSNQPRTFVAGAKLMLVDSNGNECALTPGDVVQYAPGGALAGTTAVNVQVTWSKDGRDCATGSTVTVAYDDLQEMQNHMLGTVDQGIDQMRGAQTAGKLPQTPQGLRANPTSNGFAAVAPGADTNVQSELDSQSRDADKAEQGGSSQ